MTLRASVAATIGFFALIMAGCATPVAEEPVAVEGIQPCDESTLSGVETTIGTQVDAFGREDFPSAYDMAAPDFQAAVNLEEFEDVIRSGFVPLMNVESFSVSQCVWDPELDRVETGMTLTTNSGVVGSLRYSLVLVPEGWRILGAVPNPQSQQGT
ncbi:MAG: DUF4864 domain-containing protein [Pontimonas sp.]|nr:DUF4864 domain-containing protein [Pontimonas sp.]